MIINYSKKFTFVHCPKVAGSSIELFFAPHLGPRDIQIGAWEECASAGIRPNLRFYLDVFGPRRFFSSLRRLTSTAPAIETLSFSQKKLYRRHFGLQPSHAYAADIRKFDRRAWDDHFTFCFVRNPFERMVSYYLWTGQTGRKHGGPHRSFAEFLTLISTMERGTRRLIADTFEMYSVDGSIVVDFVGRFERLHEDMKIICDKVGVPFNPQAFPHAKRGAVKQYREYYGPVERRLVERISAKELEHFGYSF